MPSLTRFIRPAAPAGRAKRIAVVAAAVCVGGLAAGVGPALAAFPGANGKIAFTSDRAEQQRHLDHEPERRRSGQPDPDSPADDGLPNWRADGRKIVFSSDSNALGTNPTPAGLESPDFELFTMNADGSKRAAAHLQRARRRGSRLVARRQASRLPTRPRPSRGPRPGLRHLHDEGLRRRRAQPHEHARAVTAQPNWSPNGRRIAFDSDRDGGTEDGPRDLHDEHRRLARTPAHGQHVVRRSAELVAERPEDLLPELARRAARDLHDAPRRQRRDGGERRGARRIRVGLVTGRPLHRPFELHGSGHLHVRPAPAAMCAT